MKFLCLIWLLVLRLEFGNCATIVCPSEGFYCLNEETYVQCDKENLASSPTRWSCASGNVCKCGHTDSNFGPCAWVFDDVQNGTCIGVAGSVISDWSNIRHTLSAVYSRSPSTHLPLALCFSETEWKEQLESLLEKTFYDDSNLFIASDSRSYGCSLHPPVQYDANPSQLWIGKPSKVVPLFGEESYIRLPDKLFALWLGWSLDMIGLNPSLLIGLIAKQSGINLKEKTNGDYWDFIVGNSEDEYSCFSKGYGGCKESIAARGGNIENGAFGTSLDNLAYDLSILSVRVANSNSSSAVPTFLSHLYYQSRPSILSSIHKSWSSNLGRSIILTSLELHWIHTIIFTLDQVGMRGTSNWEQRTRYGRDEFELAVALHVLKNGLFSGKLGSNLQSCNSSLDPVSDCNLDSGSFIKDIQTVCKIVDESSEIYDFPISWDLVQKFLGVLAWSYPFSVVESVHNATNWQKIESDSNEAFQILSKHRSSIDSPSYNGSTISLRYDWRALLAVIRAHLPQSEILVGPTMQGIDHYFYGVFTDELHVDMTVWPLKSCVVSGGKKDLCALAKTGSAPMTDVFKLMIFIFALISAL